MSCLSVTPIGEYLLYIRPSKLQALDISGTFLPQLLFVSILAVSVLFSLCVHLNC